MDEKGMLSCASLANIILFYTSRVYYEERKSLLFGILSSLDHPADFLLLYRSLGINGTDLFIGMQARLAAFPYDTVRHERYKYK